MGLLIYTIQYLQMNICMSKLEFFCNRPTLVSLIQFGLDTSSLSFEESSKGAAMASEDIEVTKRHKKPIYKIPSILPPLTRKLPKRNIVSICSHNVINEIQSYRLHITKADIDG